MFWLIFLDFSLLHLHPVLLKLVAIIFWVKWIALLELLHIELVLVLIRMIIEGI